MDKLTGALAQPTEIVFPRNNQPTRRRLLIRNRTRCDYAVKIRGNSPFIIIEPAQGFLRAGCTQPIYVTFDGTQRSIIKNSPQLLQVFCRPVSQCTEKICRRWFRLPVENNPQTIQQLAQTLDVCQSDGFVAFDVRSIGFGLSLLKTLLDLPCHALPIQSEPFPTLYADDSDTKTARAIDCDTETAWGISKNDIMILLPPNIQANSARNPLDDMPVRTAHDINDAHLKTAKAVNNNTSCYWFSKLMDRVFPLGNGHESIPPCGAGQ
ncbi:unnamed protein product [Anisakis simplex]|uniref:MSP domain-containing protein n=1 Tax=Anisakis simplex TaxID=6269 RepID=A0A0M3JXZ8_ANISI|nr:unnamed protein product [Anisakis simplex]